MSDTSSQLNLIKRKVRECGNATASGGSVIITLDELKDIFVALGGGLDSFPYAPDF